MAPHDTTWPPAPMRDKRAPCTDGWMTVCWIPGGAPALGNWSNAVEIEENSYFETTDARGNRAYGQGGAPAKRGNGYVWRDTHPGDVRKMRRKNSCFGSARAAPGFLFLQGVWARTADVLRERSSSFTAHAVSPTADHGRSGQVPIRAAKSGRPPISHWVTGPEIWCSRKKRSISRAASGPRGSV